MWKTPHIEIVSVGLENTLEYDLEDLRVEISIDDLSVDNNPLLPGDGVAVLPGDTALLPGDTAPKTGFFVYRYFCIFDIINTLYFYFIYL